MSDIIEEFLAEFLAQDDAYETGFATLTDKEGHPYVAHLDSGTGKEGKKDEKKGEKKPESEKKTEEKSEKKGAEVVNLKGEKEPEKKFKVSLYGKEQELTKSEVEDAIKKIDKDIDSSLDNVIDLQGDLKNYQKELNEAKALKEFWMYYQNRRDTNKTPKEYLAEGKSMFSGISKSDVNDINNSEGDRAEAKISAVGRYIDQVARGMVDIQDTATAMDMAMDMATDMVTAMAIAMVMNIQMIRKNIKENH